MSQHYCTDARYGRARTATQLWKLARASKKKQMIITMVTNHLLTMNEYKFVYSTYIVKKI